jgi:hypothetical protein
MEVVLPERNQPQINLAHYIQLYRMDCLRIETEPLPVHTKYMYLITDVSVTNQECKTEAATQTYEISNTSSGKN